MTAEEREQLRISLLKFLTGNFSRYGLPVRFLVTQAKLEGRRWVTDDQVEAELSYLEDKGLVDIPLKAVSPEMRNWRITATGRDHLAAMGVE